MKIEDDEYAKTIDPWDLPKDMSAIDAANLFVRIYEARKVNDDIRLSGREWIIEGFRAGVAWHRKVIKEKT